MKTRYLRVPTAALLAAFVAVILFLLMQKLVSSDRGFQGSLDPIQGIRFGPVEIPDEIESRSRLKPKRPPPPEQEPPPPRLQISRTEQLTPALEKVEIPRLDVPLATGSGLYLGQLQQIDPKEEGDVMPIVMIRPMYPREAALSGIEGWVRIEFTITESGTVRNPRVVDARPARVFNREAVRAILKWKFKPRVIDGIAVERQAMQTIDFTLDSQ